MFDFEKLDVYQVAKEQNLNVLRFIFRSSELDDYIKDQWKRSSLSILLNLAEGTGRMTNADKKHFITIARGSVFESVAIIDTLKGLNLIEESVYEELYNNYEKISKMLLGMFRSYN
jgi:four helix bundle protein